MARLTLDITMSLDGFIAGPNAIHEQPLGEGGERLHEWIVGLKLWREAHGMSGGETNADTDVLEEAINATGAVLMGRRMFSGGEGAWEDDPGRDGWWGDEPPFHVPVFILTHHAREAVPKEGGTTFTFVTDGIESALEQARSAAGEKNVAIAGGASVAQQYLKAGLLDEMQIHVAPMLLGGGVRLFEEQGDAKAPELELTGVVESPAVAHLRYRVATSRARPD
ncbi:MAG: dihydrofolate reductase family protein [Actinomycetota bacterium]|nr:dihydrofolate reductase family protein [Actinomycetota bacterium]